MLRKLLWPAAPMVLLIGAGAHAQSAPQGGAASAAVAAPSAAANQQPSSSGVGEVVVTARQRSENLQQVPMAVSAFSQRSLDAQGISTGGDLVNAVPNLTYNAESESFSIRGIGYGVVATSADQGIATHLNDAPIIVTPLNTSQFYDIERVEVLRGPQGTLYGRNATGGVVNTITAKPSSSPSASITAGYGNYNSVYLDGYVNAPINDALTVRLAGLFVRHDGYQDNVELGDQIDGENLWSTRLTIAFHPTSNFHSSLMWQHFDENDFQESYGADVKTVCQPDPGPTSVGGVPITGALTQDLLSRGCARTSLYAPAASAGTPNPFGAIFSLASLLGQLSPNFTYYPGAPTNPRQVALAFNPLNRIQQDIVQFNNVYDLTPNLSLKSLTTYSYDNSFQVFYDQQNNYFNPNGPLINSAGEFNDPAFGGLSVMGPDRFVNNDKDTEWAQELRLQSSYSGPINFNLGANYTYLYRNDLLSVSDPAYDAISEVLGLPTDLSVYPNGSGHNYYYGLTPYKLSSYAAFGEVYWQVAPDWRITGGLRYTDDTKTEYNYAVEILQPGAPGNPYVGQQSVTFREPTGRFVVDWTPKLDFTDHTLIYASYSRGYKAGGFNQSAVAGQSLASYAPEFVNAYEVGTKNELLDHRLTLDLTGFYYDYSGYQIGQVVGFNTSTVNVNASVKGVEFQSIYQPVPDLRFNFNLGYTDAEMTGGSSVNVLNRTQGDPNLVELSGITSHCVAPASAVAPLIALINQNPAAADALLAICPGTAGQAIVGASLPPALAALVDSISAQATGGVPVNLKGKDLPYSPHFTISGGAQYAAHLAGDWTATLRGDVYWQSSSYATIYNDLSDEFKGYSNVNLSLIFAKPSLGLQLQIYAKNVFDNDGITAVETTTDVAGLERFVSINDPRTFGFKITKTWP